MSADGRRMKDDRGLRDQPIFFQSKIKTQKDE